MSALPPMSVPDDATTPPGADRVYGDSLQQGRFEIQRCRPCASPFFYPRVLCPRCGGADLEWITPCGRGVVYSTTTVRRRVEQGGDYNVSIVELAEGPRMMSRVEGIAPEAVTIGLTVQCTVSTEGGQPLVVFRPAAEGPES